MKVFRDGKNIEAFLQKNNGKAIPVMVTIVFLFSVYNSGTIERTLIEEDKKLRETLEITGAEIAALTNIKNIALDNADNMNKRQPLFKKYLPNGKIKIVSVIKNSDDEQALLNLRKMIKTIDIKDIKSLLFHDGNRKDIPSDSYQKVSIKDMKTPSLYITGKRNEILFAYTFTSNETTEELFFMRDYIKKITITPIE